MSLESGLRTTDKSNIEDSASLPSGLGPLGLSERCRQSPKDKSNSPQIVADKPASTELRSQPLLPVLMFLPAITMLDETQKAEIVSDKLDLSEAKNADEQLAAHIGNKDIEIIDLSLSNVTNKGLELLTKYPNLKEVRLYKLTVTAESMENLKKLAKLEKLDLSDAKVSKGSFDQLAKLTNLRDLNLTGASITEEDMHKFAPPAKLAKLSLRDIKIDRAKGAFIVSNKGVLEDALQGLAKNSPSLKQLDLSSLYLANVDLSSLKKFRELSMLHLADTDINSNGIAVVKDLPVSGLVLDDNNITDQDLEQIATMQRLGSLFLANTLVTPVGIEHLKAVKNLRFLSLTDTAISPESYFHVRDNVLKDCQMMHIKYDKWAEDRSTLAKQESIRKTEESALIKQFGLKLSGYGIFGSAKEEKMRSIPASKEELFVVADVLNRGIVDPRSGGKPFCLVFADGFLKTFLGGKPLGRYIEETNELAISQGLSTKLYSGIGEPTFGTVQYVVMHETAHQHFPDERYGPTRKLNEGQQSNISADRLRLIKEKLGFNLVDGRWLLEGQKDDSGARTWYQRSPLDGWVRCDEQGKRLDSKPGVSSEKMQNLARVRFPTPYMPNPEEVMCEALTLIWLGGEARQQLAANCPEVYQLVLEEDRRIIKAFPDDFDCVKKLKALYPGKEIVRGFDGRLTVDNDEYQKQLTAFNKKISESRLQLK